MHHGIYFVLNMGVCWTSTSITQHMDHSGFLPLLFCNRPPPRGRSLAPSIYLPVTSLLNSSVRVQWGNLYTVGELCPLGHNASVQFHWPFVLGFTHFQSSVGQLMSSLTLQWGCVIHLLKDSVVSPPFLRTQHPKYFYLHTSKFYLCVTKFNGLFTSESCYVPWLLYRTE